jgi:SET domain-containing protein
MPRFKQSTQSWFEIRSSTIHGQGAFALQFIPKGTRVIEYTGERITPQEANVRYNDEEMEHPHTFLFTVDKRTVIDGARHGNEARYINHSCEPNCQTFIEDSRVFVEAIRDIPPGTELTYDYHLTRNGRYGAKWERRYACHCGAPSCRGTLLAPRRRKARWKKAR